MIIYKSAGGIRKIAIICLLMFLKGLSFGQGAGLSPHDLMESYLEKRDAVKRSGTKQISTAHQLELDGIVKTLEENAPDSYEYHLVKYINGNYDLKEEEHLLKASKLKPDAFRVREEMFAWHVLKGNRAEQVSYARSLRNSYSGNVREYYIQMGAGSTITGLILSGKGDALPALVLQASGYIRKDITIVNLDFLQNDTYRKRIQGELGMADVQFKGQESVFVTAALSAMGRGGFISTTVSQDYLRKAGQDCFLTGLAYQYKCPDQRKALEAFWTGSQSRLMGLSIESRYEKSLYRNYLPPLLTLYRLKLGEGQKDELLRKGITLLAEKSGKKDTVNEILKAYEHTE